VSALRVHFAGVGGQGTQTASRLLGEAALRAGVDVLVAALHGMAQRGGSVTNQVLLGGLRSPVIEPGEADVLAGFEPIENARAAPLLRRGGVAVLSTSRVVPYSLTASGGSYPEVAELHAPIRATASRTVTLDAAQLARRAGNVKAVGPVMLGALAATEVLPIAAALVRDTLAELSAADRRAVNLRAFDLGAEG
jgi:indolepyruvate ferredoxin oxidoreductase beta subunit